LSKEGAMTGCQSKEASKRKQRNCMEKQIMQGTMPGARRRVDHAQWMDNIKTWTGLIMEESVRMAEDRDK